jgi:hypothetical protein
MNREENTSFHDVINASDVVKAMWKSGGIAVSHN